MLSEQYFKKLQIFRKNLSKLNYKTKKKKKEIKKKKILKFYFSFFFIKENKSMIF
jgi:hypothetical protein